jgi:hypothetical protein
MGGSPQSPHALFHGQPGDCDAYRPRGSSAHGAKIGPSSLAKQRPRGGVLAGALQRLRQPVALASLALLALLLLLLRPHAVFGRRPFRDARCFACAGGPQRLPPGKRVLVAVNTFCGNADHRARIRASWLPRAKPLGIGVHFYVARSPHCSEAAVADEARQHGDMVLLPLHESYDKLTVKTHALLLHAAALSPPVDLLVKVDDDIYVDPGRLAARVWALHHEGLLDAGVYGGFFHNATIVLRNPGSKWADVGYPLPRYPPYASGAAYFLSQPVLNFIAGAGGQGHLSTAWHNEDASVGTWLFGTRFARYHDEGVLRCLDCATNVFHQPPWAVHVADNSVWTEEARRSPAPAHLVEASRAILEEAWGRLHGRVSMGALMRGECCASGGGGGGGGGGVAAAAGGGGGAPLRGGDDPAGLAAAPDDDAGVLLGGLQQGER